ncbi:MAG: penicillin-binding protein activator [Steroidobacteraceae bacterium]
MTDSMIRAARAVAIASLLAVVSCTSLGPGGRSPPSVDRAERAARAGDYVAAAREYEELATDALTADAARFRLRAARYFAQARRPADVERLLAMLPAQLPRADQFERDLLRVELDLLRNQNAAAWRRLQSLPPAESHGDQLALQQLRSRVAFANDRILEGIEAARQTETLSDPGDPQAGVRRRLLGELRAAAERGVALERIATTDKVTQGWLELGGIAARVARSPLSARAQVAAWQGRFPGHPASTIVRSEIIGEPRDATLQPPNGQVALLLPLGGRTASAAAQIRAGFMVASEQAGMRAPGTVTVYDTSGSTIADAISRAFNDGAGFIVGPLLREEVIAATDFAGMRGYILALNYLPMDQPAPHGMLQFALSPENEARSIAERVTAGAAGKRGIALVPDGEWGDRVLEAFSSELTRRGGELVDVERYDASQSDFSAPITHALRLDESRARHRRLQNLLGISLEFQPRRRGDIDFIFAPAPTATLGRQLRPQLRFHYASDIPTYSTSSAFEPHPTANQDMEGLIFPDMPWVLDDDDDIARIRTAAATSAAAQGQARGKLFAFGYDAYQIYAAIAAGADPGSLQIDGLTGHISFDADGRARRDLQWAEIRRGEARRLDRN